MATTFIHSGPGNVKSGVNDRGEAFATLTLSDGTVKHFSAPIDPTREDPHETNRRVYSLALQAHQQHEEQQESSKRVQEQGAILLAALQMATPEQVKHIRTLLNIAPTE